MNQPFTSFRMFAKGVRNKTQNLAYNNNPSIFLFFAYPQIHVTQAVSSQPRYITVFDTRIFPFGTFPSSNILCCWCICLCQPRRLLPWAVCSSDVPTTALNIFHNIIQFPFPQLTRVNNRFDSAFFQSFALCRSRTTYLQHPWPDWRRELWMRLIGVTLSRSCSWSWLWPKKANWISCVLI